MKPLRPAGDLSELPSVVFGWRSLMWWATLGFVLIEGFTLVLCAASYVYLTQNFTTWPPEHTPLPSLGAPTIQVIVMLASLPVVWWTAKAARRFELGKVRIGLVLATLFAIAFVGLRAVELLVSLNVRWDTNAYGSAAWTIVGAHTTLLLLDVADTLGLTFLFFVREMPGKSYSDANDNSFYWYFTVGIWIPIYLIVYVGPRIF